MIAKASDQSVVVPLDRCEVACVDPERVAAWSLSGCRTSGRASAWQRRFSVLSDPGRVRLIVALLEGELCVCDLAAVTGLSETACSHNLRLLRSQRLVRYRKQGRNVYYALDDAHIRLLLDVGLQHVGEGTTSGAQRTLHGAGHGHAGDRSASKRALRISLGFTVAYGVVQVVTGVWFHSLALIADAVHNVSDGGAIALALAAAWAAGLPARGARTFGWRRAEILAALVNGLALVVISGWIFYEAYTRLQNPPDVVGAGRARGRVGGRRRERHPGGLDAARRAVATT